MSGDRSEPESLDQAIAKDVLGRIGLDRLLRAIESITGPLSGHGTPDAITGTLWVPFRGTLTRLPIEEIVLVEAHRDYVKVHDRNRSYLLRATVSDIAAQLGDRFLRIHRSSVIARARVTGIRHIGKGRWIVLIDDRHEVSVGRTYLNEVRGLLRRPSSGAET